MVARIASEHDVDVSQVPGTGRGGRVTKKDILASSRGRSPPRRRLRLLRPSPHPRPRPSRRGTAAAGARAGRRRGRTGPGRSRRSGTRGSGPGEQLEPMTAMRKGIAEHMRRSLDTSAHVTSAIEVDMSKVVALREKLKPEFQKSYGVNPTYLIFVARAVVETLKDYPWINGEIRGDKIVTRNYVNLGFAVELADGKGLIVPVVKNAEGLNLLGMARAVTDIAERARNKQLTPDEVQGGTFTITNPGGYGTFHGTPVISQPQAAILGTYAVVKRPWVIQDEHGKDVIAIRPIMNLTLTYDHRLVDGALAGRFLRDLRQKLETWGERRTSRGTSQAGSIGRRRGSTSASSGRVTSSSSTRCPGRRSCGFRPPTALPGSRMTRADEFEPALTDLLADRRRDDLPGLIAWKGKRMLTRDVETPAARRARRRRAAPSWEEILPLYAELQIDFMDVADRARTLGTPDDRPELLPDRYERWAATASTRSMPPRTADQLAVADRRAHGRTRRKHLRS